MLVGLTVMQEDMSAYLEDIFGHMETIEKIFFLGAEGGRTSLFN